MVNVVTIIHDSFYNIIYSVQPYAEQRILKKRPWAEPLIINTIVLGMEQ